MELEASTSLPSDVIHFFSINLHVKTSSSIVILKTFLLCPVLLPSCPTTILPPLPSTLTSYHPSLPLSPSLPSILHSLRQTIKQAFPWLTCGSPLPPHHPKPQTEGELQPQIQCGAERSWILSQIWVPQGFRPLWPVYSVLLSADGVTQTPDMYAPLTSQSHRRKFLWI